MRWDSLVLLSKSAQTHVEHIDSGDEEKISEALPDEYLNDTGCPPNVFDTRSLLDQSQRHISKNDARG